MFPMAMSAFPFLAAETEVQSSGRDVPSATMVSPINLSLSPNERAIALAASTVKLLPSTIIARPSIMNNAAFTVDISFGESSCFISFFAIMKRYVRYTANAASRIIPSTIPILPLSPVTKRSTVITIIKGISYLIVDFATARGTITEDIPRIISILSMLLPTILPMVISALPFRAAEMLTAASGELVPIATIVRPITSCGMPNFAAIPEEPSTKISAPLISNTNPMIRSPI